MGFSFGCYTAHGAVALTPDVADAVILTAISFNETGLNVNGLLRSYVPRIVNLQNPALFGDRDNGFMTWVDNFAQIHNYFQKPNYDDETADFAEFSKQPFAVTEFLTLLSAPRDTSDYEGPVLAITGDTDYIFCDGYCYSIFDEPAETLYRNSANFSRVLHPGASYNINFHHNATGAYTVITGF
ncbi:hypothetical protein BDY21DRAFT_12345 [Lineolata rhizophorae]|uniref:Alpha/Beta hydrolase protein n=1 Tax=Lineolata rhizophorae TaxID=578093 RepID=A0A6A6PEV0_9PEZI|nr:hypothetical protein BDY21DRAFT_12345 [Lineolata rhizophorae]